MTGRVEHMVCPMCARMHGSGHVSGCPESFNAEAAYVTGWLASRDGLVYPLLERIQELESAPYTGLRIG